LRLDPKDALTLLSRGYVYGIQNDYEKAIRDFDEVIRLDPESTSAICYRGNARRARHEYDKAFADYDEAIRLDPKDPWAPFSRAVVQFILRRPEAIAGFQTVRDLEQQKGRLSPYCAILGHFAARQAGDDDRARRFLKQSPSDDAWPNAVIRYLSGESSEAALLKLATDQDKRTEARCFLGLDEALNNRPEAARTHFRWVKDHGDTRSTEYDIALAELRRLEDK